MRGGLASFVILNILLVSMFQACGDRRTGDAPATDTAQNSGAVSPGAVDSDTRSADSAAAGTPDTSTTSRRDTTPVRSSTPARDTAAAVPAQRAATAPKPARRARPSTPAPAATAQPADTSPASTPPAPTDTSPASTPTASPPQPADTPTTSTQANAPLRDEYHRAPLDTVTQQVYDGWKQYNLNCARCHGEDVMGTTIAPHLITSLKPNGPISTKELFVQTVCAGRPEKGMPAWCPLGMEMDKIEAIHAYVKGRSDGKIRPGRPALRQ
jgi:mono/diheme cytochrome c family protein